MVCVFHPDQPGWCRCFRLSTVIDASFQQDPSIVITQTTVLRRITMSRLKDQFVTYSSSSFTRWE
jgi:hypothetical protein